MKYLIVLLLLVSCTSNLDRVKEGIKKFCLEGHVYYISAPPTSYRAVLASKLDDNGNPVKCKEF